VFQQKALQEKRFREPFQSLLPIANRQLAAKINRSFEAISRAAETRAEAQCVQTIELPE
jgi:hypothetical protein